MNTNTTAAATADKGKGYNIKMNVISAPEVSTMANGNTQVKFRAKVTLRGRATELTVVAQGKVAELVEGLEVGNDPYLRCLISEVKTEDGKRGGTFLTVIDKPRAKAKAAAA
jgi:hypothetical protein